MLFLRHFFTLLSETESFTDPGLFVLATLAVIKLCLSSADWGIPSCLVAYVDAESQTQVLMLGQQSLY